MTTARAYADDTSPGSGGFTISASNLDPNVAALGQLVGLLTPGASPGTYNLNSQWFANPLQNTATAVTVTPPSAMLVKDIARYKEMLRDATSARPKLIMAAVRAELLEMKEKYGDSRRTRITSREAEEFEAGAQVVCAQVSV